MRVVVVWREGMDYSRQIEEWLHDFEHRTGHQIESIDPDTPSGTGFCEAYGIVRYPTFIAIDDSSQMVQQWSGEENIPRFDDVAFYTLEN